MILHPYNCKMYLYADDIVLFHNLKLAGIASMLLVRMVSISNLPFPPTIFMAFDFCL